MELKPTKIKQSQIAERKQYDQSERIFVMTPS